MTFRLFGPTGLASIIVVCMFVPSRGIAQPLHVGGGIGYPGFGPGYPAWGYPGLPPGGPFLGYAYPYSYPWYRGAVGATWTNGLHLNGPPVPVYGPLPGVFGASDLNEQWRAHPSLGWGVGWVGVYSASPRPRPTTVNVWAPNDPRGNPGKHAKVYPGGIVVEGVPGPSTPPAQPGGSLVLSVRVPQPAAEVFVDGMKMTQSGTDRLYESPPLEAGKEYQYELTARWVQGGVSVEQKKVVTGKPGEVVRVDFP
ncbi:MAG TPA: TIGR03000 domain-containing protein [Gemmataceae bacterium]|nr:TIGR03000 domain-containing protein [Gemmataceae bacterium]